MNREVGPIINARHMVSADAWSQLAKSLGVEEPALRAVAEVESAGSGFLADRDLPKILFEGHAFHRLTGGRFDAHKDISYPKWDKTKYKGPVGRMVAPGKSGGARPRGRASIGQLGDVPVDGVQLRAVRLPRRGSLRRGSPPGRGRTSESTLPLHRQAPFLEALRTKDWARLRTRLQRRGLCEERYDKKMAKAYARWSKSPQPAKAGKSASADAGPHPLPTRYVGRSRSRPSRSKRRRNRKVRNVRPDPMDLRDWVYHPSIVDRATRSPFAVDPRPIKYRRDTNACTGFALATVIEYLLDRAATGPSNRFPATCSTAWRAATTSGRKRR